MPRFNASGDYEAGIGGGDEVYGYVTLIVNGKVCDPGPGGGGDWLTDQEVACYRYQPAPFRAVAIDKTTGANRFLRESPLGFNAVTAGGGRWATTETQTGRVIMDDGTEVPYPLIALGQHDGCIAMRAHPYNGSGLIVDGKVLVPAASDHDVVSYGTNCWDVQVIDKDHVVWRERDGAHAVGLPVPQLLTLGSYGLRVANLKGQWWVLYLAAEFNGSLVCHPVDSFMGCQLTAPGANAYRPDLVAVGSRLLAVWANNESEMSNAGPIEPGVTSGYPIIDLTTTAPKPPDPEPPEPPATRPPAVTITSYAPTSGSWPLTVTAVYAAEPGSGPITELHWQYRAQGSTTWIDSAVNPPEDPDHHYVFMDVGTYELRLLAIGPGGEGATGAQRLVTVTSVAPEPPQPEPEPEPPQGGSMAVYLKLGHYYTGVDPTPLVNTDGDAQFPVYSDREEGGAWEEVTLTPHDDGGYDALYVAANRTLSIQPDGTLQTREAGTYGGYEAVYATTQPDGASILYRRDEDVVIPCNILTIEDRS